MVIPLLALDADPDETRLAQLVDELRREVDALSDILPAAVAAQWTASPAGRSKSDTARPKGAAISDPTATAALDPRRSQLRSQVVRSDRAIRDAVVTLRAARLALDSALAAWDGDGEGAGE